MIRLQNFKVLPVHIQKRLKTSTTSLVRKPNVTATAYQPKNVEVREKYENWEKINLFTAASVTPKPSFSMVLPPPNVTGNLHLG